MAREMCEQLLGEVNRAGGVAADVWRILIERPGRFPNIKAIALKIEMHPRALRRKLEAEGTSYSALLAEVRRRLAIEYLRKTQMVNKEIASRLGYSDERKFPPCVLALDRQKSVRISGPCAHPALWPAIAETA